LCHSLYPVVVAVDTMDCIPIVEHIVEHIVADNLGYTLVAVTDNLGYTRFVESFEYCPEDIPLVFVHTSLETEGHMETTFEVHTLVEEGSFEVDQKVVQLGLLTVESTSAQADYRMDYSVVIEQLPSVLVLLL